MSRGKRTDVALYEGIGSLPGVNATGWMPGVGMPMGQMGGMGGSDSGGAPSQSLFAMIDDRMRGRWTYAIITGGGLAIILAIIGYLSAEPLYVSSGTIEVQAEIKPILSKLDINEIPNYDRFANTQVEYIKSQRVIGQAADDEKVKSLKISKGMIKGMLQVERDRNSTLIFVACEAEDADVAEASVNAVLKSYDTLYAQNFKDTVDALLAELSSKAKDYERQRASRDEAIRAITLKYGATDLISVQKANQDEINRLKTQIAEGEFQLARLSAAAKPDAPNGQLTVQVPKAGALMRIEPRLGQAQADLDAAQSNFDRIALQWKPDMQTYKNANRTVQVARDNYDRLYQAAIDRWRKGDAELMGDGLTDSITADDIEVLKKRVAVLEPEQKRLVTDISNLASLTYEQTNILGELQRIRDRINTVETEINPINKLIRVSAYGSVPTEPTKDARKMRLMMGIAAGFCMSFGAFFLLGTIDRRAFGASQLGLGGNLPPCLGVLPDLGASLNDPETSDVASHCVHQIRNQIEAVRDPRGGYLLCISSPFQGDGKTSIVMALGWSYAAAGYNTLVIDCDMIGRSLTRQLGLTGREGLREALISKELNGSVSRLPWANLSAIPVGVDARFGPENIRRMDLERLIEQLRDQYDMIIIDTGPLLGSLESTPVTAVADGVVFSVRRGRSRSKLEECVSRLKLVGTPCIGVILNCAQRSDCNRYVSEASLAAAEEERSGRPALPSHAPGERNALVRAVQTTTRQRDVDAPSAAEADSEQAA